MPRRRSGERRRGPRLVRRRGSRPRPNAAAVFDAALHLARTYSSERDLAAAETTGAVGHVQFQDITRQMLEHVVTAVDEVNRQAQDVIEYADGELPAAVVLERLIQIDDLRTKHVMARQRSTHATNTGEDGEGDTAPAVELF